MKTFQINVLRFFLFLITVFVITLFAVQSTPLHASTKPKKELKVINIYMHHNVCGFDVRGFARCHARVATQSTGKPLDAATIFSGALGPAQLHGAYKLPCTPLGPVQNTCPPPQSFGPQTIAIVDAFHTPTLENDLHVYSTTYGIPDCNKANGCLTVVNQSGGTNLTPIVDAGWAFETSLDVQTAHALCQTCKILVVEANTNSLFNLASAVNTAANLGATAISNSYGGAEWSSQTSYDSYYNHPGIAITASAGDSGYGAEFPASSPNVIAVGGTSLVVYTDNTYASESVWNGTGSGCSLYDAAPNWQLALSNWTLTHCGTKRAISDIAADADPNTGVAIYDSTPYAGSSGWWQVGGTSLASPIIASAYVLAGGVPPNTQAASLLYQNTAGVNFHDITNGTNGNCTTIMCNSAVSYDGPTGLGSPNGIAGFSNTITPSPTVLPNPTVVPTAVPTLTPSPTPVGPDTTKPTVLITYPTNNSTVPKRTNITVTATASDNVSVTKVNFYHNNLLFCSRSTPPYSCVMSTPSFTNQTTTYKATVYDAAGNNASNTVTVKAN